MLAILFLLCAPFDLPAPYAGMELLPLLEGEAWYGNGPFLRPILEHYQAKTVVEVGSWLGRSTQDIARTIAPRGGRVFAVDHFLGSEEHQDIPHLPELYEHFLSNMVHWGVASNVIPIRLESTEAARFLEGTEVDLIYLDASHDTESVLKDLRAWFPYVKGHGVLCGDDTGWPTVRTAVEQFARENDLKLYMIDNFWHLLEYRRPLRNCPNKNRMSYEKKLCASPHRIFWQTDTFTLDGHSVPARTWQSLPEKDWR